MHAERIFGPRWALMKEQLHVGIPIGLIETDWGVGLIEYTDNLDFQIPEKLDIEYDVCSKKRYGFLHIYTDNLHMVFK